MKGPTSRESRRVVAANGIAHPLDWSTAISAGQWVFVSGILPSDYTGGLSPDAQVDPRNPFVCDPLELQAKRILSNLAAVLAATDCDIRRDIIRAWQWFPTDYPSDDAFRMGRLLWPRWQSPLDGYIRQVQLLGVDSRRSSTGLGVRRLTVPGALMALDVLAVRPQAGVERVGIKGPLGTPHAERALYEEFTFFPATRHGDWIFLAGCGATDFAGDFMATRHMGEPSNVAPAARVNPYFAGGSDIQKQTDYTLEVLSRIAEAAGTSFDRCVKADVAIGHPSDFVGMDLVWRKWFPKFRPARTVITGTQLVMKGPRVEIAMQMLANNSTLSPQVIRIKGLPPPPGHDPHAVRAGDLLFLSTQLPTDSTGAVPAELAFDSRLPYFKDTAYLQAQYLLKRVAAICEAGGTSLRNVCKVQLFMDDLGNLPSVLHAWREAFPVDPPALTALETGGGDPLLVPNAHISMDVIAYSPNETSLA